MTDSHKTPLRLPYRAREKRDSTDLMELFNEERFVRLASTRRPFESSEELELWFDHVQCVNKYEVVGILDEKAVAFGGLYVLGDDLSHSGWLMLGVRQELQGRGVGSDLLQILITTGKVAAGLRRLQLTVFADNETALRLYQRHGFEIEGRHRRFVRRGEDFLDAFTMARLFEEPEAAKGEAARRLAAA
jgi:L-phenylalanine/L-methionine N-acetyltransferase